MRRLELSQDMLAALVAEVVRRGFLVRLRATGKSMGRALPDGSRPALMHAGAANVRQGDVVLCRLGPRLVLHRARAVGPAGIWVQGDALARPDGLVGWHDVLAKVHGQVPRRGHWRRWARALWRAACSGT